MKIYLVQRAKINKNINDEMTLSQSIYFDYMGSAEYEFGALPESLRRMEKKPLVYQNLLMENGAKELYIYGDAGIDYNEYCKLLVDLYNDKIRTKETSDFVGKWPWNWKQADFWWDIENDVMWSFDSVYMLSLPKYLQNSWHFMNKSKPKS